MKTISCGVCGISVVQKKRNQKYCSTLCYGRAWAHNNREKYNSRMRSYQKQRRKIARGSGVCPSCKTPFVRPHANQVYCSRACHQRHYILNNQERTKGWQRKSYRKSRHTFPWRILLDGAKQRAKKSRIEFTLSPDWASRNWTGRCSLTGLTLSVGPHRHALSPSIDRIDPKIGYIPSNCRFVAWAVNAFKQDWSDGEMYKISAAIMSSPKRPAVGI